MKKPFDLLWAEGQSMSMDEAVDFAMSETDECLFVYPYTSARYCLRKNTTMVSLLGCKW